jgi:opacity protein-like surface antigen
MLKVNFILMELIMKKFLWVTVACISTATMSQAGPWANNYYLGGFLTFDTMPVDVEDLSGYNGAPNITYDASGLGGTVFVGRLWDMSQPRYYWGLEGEIGISGLTGDQQHASFVGVASRVDDSIASISSGITGSLTARIAYEASDTTLVYAKAGVSATQVDVAFNDTNPAGLIAIHDATTGSKTLVAPIIGIGFDHKFDASSNMSLRGELTHAFYSDTIDTVSGGYSFSHTVDGMTSAKLGLSFAF